MGNMQKWKRVAGQNIRHLTKEEALVALARIRATGHTIHQPAIREITGGFASQTINGYVTRKLAAKAGLIKKEFA